MRRRSLLSPLSVVAWMGAVSACLDDLRPAATCPPPAQVQGSSCVAAIDVQGREPGCFSSAEVECLTGPRSDRACIPDECPTSESACWPDGDCPPAVTKKVGEAECRRLPTEALGLGLPSEAMCMQRCPSCAAVCDGIGPVIAVYDDPGGTFEGAYPLIVDIGSRMPDEGKLGIYLRLRGLANFQVVVLKGELSLERLDELELVGSYFVLTPLGTELVEHILYRDAFLGIEPYAWEHKEDRPTAIAILPPGGKDEAGLTLTEIDCIVPFVVD